MATDDVAVELRDALTKNAKRVVDLFREWDEDGDGTVSKKEFRKAIPLIVLDVPKAAVDQLFDEWDPDQSGMISLAELIKKLRRGGEVELDDSLKAGAAGEIGMESTTKIAVRLLPTAATADVDSPQYYWPQVRKGLSKRGSALGEIDLDESSGKSVAQQLRDILSKNAVRVVDLFREWDEDGDGTVSKKEFRKAMPLLGFDAPRAQIDQLFDTFDPDGGGSIGIDELNKALRRGGEVKLSADMQAGAKGKIGTVSTTKIAVRKGLSKRGSALGQIDLDESSDKSVAQQLRDILSKNGVRVVDLFREWDEDGDGTVSKKEFRKAMPLLGFDAPRATVDQVFDSLDPDGGGAISIDELNKALRRGGDVKLAAGLQAGAAGKIETSSKNKSTRLAAPAGGAARPSPRGSSPRDPSPRQRAQSPRSVPSARPETAPSAGGRHEGGGDGQSGLLPRAAAARPQSTEGTSRPPSRSPSRSNLSVAGTSASVSSHGGKRSNKLRMQRLEEEMPALISASGNVRRAADIYLAGGYAVASRKQLHGALPPVLRVPQPPDGHNPNPRVGRARGAGKGWSSGGANSPGRGRGIGSKEELEAALSAAQTALVMAKERVLSLEDQNYSLRQKLDERGGLVTMTRDKLLEAQQALQDTLLTEADFAAIKQKYMHENFGVVPGGGVAPGASSAAQPEIT